MSTNGIKAVRVGSSDNATRLAELRANHESAELKNLIERGFQVKDVKVKRPRIQKERFKVIITCFGPMKVTSEEFTKYCNDFKTVQL